MQPATINQQQRPRIKVIKLRNRRPAKPMCNVSFTSAKKSVPRKKTTKQVVEKLLSATPKAVSLKVARTDRKIDSKLSENLFSDVKAIFRLKKVAQLRTQSILDSLVVKKPWATICNGKPLNSRMLAKLLKPYGIHSMDLRFEERQAYKGYKRDWFINNGRSNNQ